MNAYPENALQQAGFSNSSTKQRPEFWVKRSLIGSLRIRFDGGPSYPKMVEDLRQALNNHGRLVRRGERLSGSDWVHRIKKHQGPLSECQASAIETLMAK